MGVSLSSYCQYPAVKVIGKDSVVVMTIKQGQDINQKFMELTGEIQKLNDSLSQSKNKIVFLKSEQESLNSSFGVLTIKSRSFEEENTKLKKMLEDNEKSHLNERKKWAGWMFFSFVVTVMLGALK